MRKTLLSLLLPLFMLLSQQGALWHEVGHFGNGQAPASQKKETLDKVCESCIAFAHLAAAAKPELFASANTALTYAAPAAGQLISAASAVPTQRSRGPPEFL